MRWHQRSRQSVFLTLLVAMAVGLFSIPVFAQTITATPVSIGENKTGEVTAAAPVVNYALTVTNPQMASLQVISLTPGFLPTLRVLTFDGVVQQNVTNLNNATLIQTTAGFTAAGQYLLEVGGANGSVGQFVLSVQGGPELPPPMPLVVGLPISTAVEPEAPFQFFSFLASPSDVLLLNVKADNVGNTTPGSGPLITLRDAATNNVLATSSTRLIGSRLRIPPGTTNYLLEVSHGGSASTEPFTVCLAPESGTITCPGDIPAISVVPTAALPPTVAPPTPTPYVPPFIPPAGPCMVASSRGQTINIRSGPGLEFAIIGQLAPGVTAPVQARMPDSSWYQINLNGIVGWVSATVVIAGGNCLGVTVATLPPPATPTGTLTAAATATATSTETPTATPTATSTLGIVFPPIVTFDVLPVTLDLLPIAPTLNYSLPAVYGSTALWSGFLPDPFSVGVTAGGPVNSSYLGGSCYGYTTSAPTFSVNYTNGAFPTLRFYFIGSGDATMIINSPSDSYSCVDDSFGTLNPTIDFNSPQSGRYDIWVASYVEGASISGTLFVTESTGNHP